MSAQSILVTAFFLFNSNAVHAVEVKPQILLPIPESSQSIPTKKIILSEGKMIRYEVNGILEAKAELPAGAQIEIPLEYTKKYLPFRNSKGNLERSSTGFIHPIRILSVPADYQDEFTAEKINDFNTTAGGLSIFASIIEDIEGTEGHFAVHTTSEPNEAFLEYFHADGRPKFRYSKSIRKRFGSRLNHMVDGKSLSSEEREKWRSIYSELKRAATRTEPSEKSYMMIDSKLAQRLSAQFEKTGAISTRGAWTIATRATAVRHGFESVPCAEFQSEVLRQAYQRAGYRVTDDFNENKKNPLIWHHTAAVVNFSAALYRAGWIPWDASVYRPITGSFIMHQVGKSPGHTYISAGEDGMIVVDNGSPQGKDLRKSSARVLSMMYQSGVFFLPPGINPPAWSE
ncbi:hypothetical protein AZI87_08145 [Bdellovibrio bacteriovorus]|uniref:Uncharacterized protein n=1 Tax=Bdellovibrio bacteriovorus TaxID=959 RepID=A0A162GXR2_BDEBC|nr:hypothetical protein [Bdellovibrio bacteriovorus]KYG69175.1 hypothetical protein AZI87_08145 [Bdellovibrio bacteriovorus]